MNEIKTLEQRLKAHPKLRDQILAMLDLADGQIEKADDVEEQLIGDVSRFGNQIMQDWAESRAEVVTKSQQEIEAGLVRNGKKTPLAHHLRRNNPRRTDIQVVREPSQALQ